MVILLKKVKSIYYTASNGKVFLDKKKCEIYEMQLNFLIKNIDGLRIINADEDIRETFVFYTGNNFYPDPGYDDNITIFPNGIYFVDKYCSILFPDNTEMTVNHESSIFYCNATDFVNELNGKKIIKRNELKYKDMLYDNNIKLLKEKNVEKTNLLIKKYEKDD